MVPATRALTRAVFSHLWGLFFAWLDSRGEMEALRVLKRYYFLPDNFASWNGGIDTVMPGSYSGSQAQEAWHRVKLRPTLETLKIPVEEVLVKLNGLVASRLEQAKLRYVSLEDAPALQWCPRLCAEGQDYLSATFCCIRIVSDEGQRRLKQFWFSMCLSTVMPVNMPRRS